MSLVAGSWMGLSNTYQGMVLRLAQLQGKRLELSRRMDRHELAILATTQGNNLNPTSRKLADESFGMSRRSRPFPSPGRATYQK